MKRWLARRFGESPDEGEAQQPAPRLEAFIADVGSGWHSNWTSVLLRTMGGQGVDSSRYKAALGRVRSLSKQPKHSAAVADAQRRALERARPIIRSAMVELSASDPGARATEPQRIATCEHFTGWAAAALALEAHLDPSDVAILLDPFADVLGMGSRPA